MAKEKKQAKPTVKTKELTIGEIIAKSNILSSVNIRNLDPGTQHSILAAGMAHHPHVKRYQEFQAETVKRLRPENMEELEAKTKNEDLPEAERNEAQRIIDECKKRLNECLQKELEKTVTVTFEDVQPIGLTELAKIGDNNDDTPVGMLLLIRDAINLD